MILKLKRTPGIYLVGFMASGKSTIGRMLADEIGWRFVDMDEEIESVQRRTIGEIFESLGEEEFRRIEHDAISRRVRSVRCGVPTVLALGGGAFTRPENVQLLSENGITVWIDTAFAIVRKRAEGAHHRPLARDADRFRQLFDARRKFYSQAEYRVQVTEDSSRKALADVLKLPLFE